MSDQPTAPWWATLIAILLTAAVSVVGTIYALGRGPSVPGVPGTLTAPGGSVIKDTITYIPHILLLFGVLADMFTYQGVYSIPSLVGLLSIPANFLFKYFWIGIFDTVGKVGEILASAPQVNPRAELPTVVPKGGAAGFFDLYDGCNVQGFQFLASPYAPQTLVVTATVFSYYVFDLIMNRGWLNATAAIVGFGVFFAAEMFVIGNCDVEGQTFNKYLRGLMALAEGMLFGGTGYAVVQAQYPTYLPSSAIYPFPRKNARDLKKNSDGQLVDSDGRPYSQLPNGQAVPDIADSAGQKAWGASLNFSSGTGQPAMSSSCSSSK